MTRTFAFSLAALVLSLSAGAASAATPYDGSWTVLIMTQSGNCDAAYRYPLKIQNGAVLYGGQNDFKVSGKVSGGGAVNVSISRGEQKASGSGKLTANGGSGSWSGGSASSKCAGRWQAERS